MVRIEIITKFEIINLSFLYIFSQNELTEQKD